MPSDSPRPCACGRHYDAERWAALPLFARLTAADVSSLVTPWPPHRAVEVRVCAHCDRPMSRLQHAAGAEVAKRPQAIAAWTSLVVPPPGGRSSRPLVHEAPSRQSAVWGKGEHDAHARG